MLHGLVTGRSRKISTFTGAHLVDGLRYMAMTNNAIDLWQVLEAAYQRLIVSLRLLLAREELTQWSTGISLQEPQTHHAQLKRSLKAWMMLQNPGYDA